MDIKKRDEYRKSTPVEERLSKSTERMLDHIGRKNLNSRQRQHLYSWTMECAHSVFEMNPSLREEGCQIRYHIGKEGRKQGFYGKALTEFIEKEFQHGTWYRHVPDEVLKQSV